MQPTTSPTAIKTILWDNDGVLVDTEHLFVLTCDDVTRTKPDPEPYLKALARSARAPSDCVVIEDSARGLRAAKQAGLLCWVIPTGMTTDGDFSAADAVLEDIRDVPKRLGVAV